MVAAFAVGALIVRGACPDGGFKMFFFRFQQPVKVVEVHGRRLKMVWFGNVRQAMLGRGNAPSLIGRWWASVDRTLLIGLCG